MNILWTTNITLPSIASKVGLRRESKEGWLMSLADSLKKEQGINLGVLSFEPSLKEPQSGVCDDIYYNIIPTSYFCSGNKEKLEKATKQIISEFSPQLLHINGTEYGYALKMMPLLNIQSVISIQGMVSVCLRYLYTGFNVQYLLKNPIFFAWLIRNYNSFEQRGKNEIKYFKAVGHAIGRTEWDKTHVRQINPNIVYHHCNESMRPSFFKRKWDITKIKRHQIYISQASYQIKGLHLILEGIAELKNDYPDLQVIVAGKNPLTHSLSLTGRVKSQFDYGNYLKKVIRQKKLEDVICFVGNQNEEGVVKHMLNSHVTIVPSTIENSPNSMCEAQCLGLPCVATYVGGTPDLSENGVLSPLYRCEEWEMMVAHVKRIFDSDQYATMLSDKAREVALERNNQANNSKVMVEIYNEIINTK